MIIRLLHSQTTEGSILLSNIEDGLPNKEFGIQHKQQVYIPYYHSFFDKNGKLQIDRNRAGYTDLVPSDSVKLSQASGAIFVLKVAGIFEEVEIPTGALKRPTITRAYQSAKATEDGAVIIEGTNFISYAPDITSVTLIDSVGANKLTLDENDSRVTITESSIIVDGFGDGDSTYEGGTVTVAANDQEIVSTIDLPFVTEWTTTAASESITLPLINSGTYDMVVDWGDGTTDEITAFNAAEATHTYVAAGTYDVAVKGIIDHWNFFDVATSKDKVRDIKQWGSLRLGDAASSAFRECTNLNVTAADAPNLVDATSLSLMFLLCPAMVGSVGFSKWDVSAIEDTRFMFYGTAFNQDISDWDTSSIKTFIQMFRNAEFFNQNIGKWDTSSMTSASNMLQGASAFNQNLGGWDVSSLGLNGGSATELLTGTATSTENYDSLLNGWASQNVQPGVSFGAGTIQYSNTGKPGRDTLTEAPNNWTITDGGNIDA